MTPRDTVIHGDALAVLRTLADGSVDAVVTDPPYSSGGFNETGKKQANGQGLRSETLKRVGWFISDNMTTAGITYLMREVALEAFHALKDGGSLLVFTDWRMAGHLAPAMESSGLRHQNLIVWNKKAIGLGFGFRPQHELIMQFAKGTAKYYDATMGNVIDCGRIQSGDKHHQTEKPVPLMMDLLRVVAPPGGLVVDPFCGSGSTLVAAQKLGMSYIGADRDEHYVEVARKRLAEPYTLPMFDAVETAP